MTRRSSARLFALRLALGGAAAATLLGLAATTWAGDSAPRPSRPSTGRAVAKPTTPPGYFHIVREWHTPTPGRTAPTDASGRTMLVLRSLYLKDYAELPASSDHGGFSAADLPRAEGILREPGSNKRIAVEPRTLDALYRIQVHFRAQEIRVLSGYRAPVPGKTNHGNHGRGRAVDFVVPGAADEDVARFAREFGFVGVGTYPISGFVHVDVRDRSYFWRDSSGPGRKNRERGILLELAQRSDTEARARGDAPPPPFLALGSDAGAPVDEEEDE